MSSNTCRFCFASTTRLTSTITDEIIQKFLQLVPQLDITGYPSTVCQLCYGKAKISFDFIQKISEVQKKFAGTAKSSRSTIKMSSLACEALEKVQKTGTISIRKVNTINQGCEVDLLDGIEEVQYEEDYFQADESSDDDFEVKKDDSDEDDEEYLEFSDDDFEPAPKKSKSVNRGRKSTTVTREKTMNSSDTKEIIIDAPIAFSCAKCRDKFTSFDALTDHMKSRVCQNTTSVCKECGKQFLNKKSLYNHMASHKPKEKFMCELCAKEYNHQFDLETHMESAHLRIVKRDCIYRCTHCVQKFQSQMELLEHVKEHQREKKEAPRLCEVCAKVCPNLKAYQSHIIIHKEKKAHMCTICGKGFAKLFLFQQHMHVHTGIKAFTCDICNKSYAKRDSLRIHKKRDHPEVI